MNKEKIITVAIGLSAGILVTGGYFAVTTFLPQINKPAEKIIIQPATTSTPAPEVSGATSFQLTVDSPGDKSSTSSATTLVSGKTAPGATLVIFANSDEKIASADATGNFSASVKLEEGENEISVTAFANKINSAVVHRNVTLEISQ